MKRQKISGIYADASSFDGQKLTVCGWVRTVRDMKNFGFIELNDGSCFKSLQVARSAHHDRLPLWGHLVRRRPSAHAPGLEGLEALVDVHVAGCLVQE